MQLLVSILINALSVFIVAYFLPGVELQNFGSAIIVAIVLGLVNLIVKPIVSILTLPINLMTLGLFNFVINGLMILLVDYFVDSFTVQNFLWAVLFSLLISLVNSLLQKLVKN